MVARLVRNGYNGETLHRTALEGDGTDYGVEYRSFLIWRARIRVSVEV